MNPASSTFPRTPHPLYASLLHQARPVLRATAGPAVLHLTLPLSCAARAGARTPARARGSGPTPAPVDPHRDHPRPRSPGSEAPARSPGAADSRPSRSPHAPLCASPSPLTRARWRGRGEGSSSSSSSFSRTASVSDRFSSRRSCGRKSHFFTPQAWQEVAGGKSAEGGRRPRKRPRPRSTPQGSKHLPRLAALGTPPQARWGMGGLTAARPRSS